jgi:hypothetical protein
MDEFTQEMITRSFHLEARPVEDRPDRVRLQQDGADAVPSKLLRRQYRRYHLAYVAGEGFTDCGEYEFYYDPETRIVFGACSTCGEVYIRPVGQCPHGRRRSDDTRYRGTISRRSLAAHLQGVI